MDGAETKAAAAVGILCVDPLTCQVLCLLLAQEGYEARALDARAVFEDPGGALAGVDLVLCVPGLGEERRGALMGAIKGDPASAAVPVVDLSSVLREEPPDEQAGSVVPWPCSVEELVGAIGRALLLAPAPGGAQASQ